MKESNTLKNFRWSRGGRILLHLLMFVMLAVSVASWIGVGLLAAMGAYEGTGTKLDKYPLMYHALYEDAKEAYFLYDEFIETTTPRPEMVANQFSPRISNYNFQVVDLIQYQTGEPGRGRVLYQSPGFVAEQPIHEFWMDGVVIECYLTPNLPAPDQYQDVSEKLDLLAEYRYAFLCLAPLGTVLFLLILLTLFRWAGHRRGVEGIVLGPMDKIPLDLYLAVVTVSVSLLLYWGIYWVDLVYNHVARLYTVISILSFVGAYFLLTAFFLSLAARVKVKGWLKNTLLWRLGGWLFKVCRWAFFFLRKHLGSSFSRLPLVWKAVLILLAYGGFGGLWAFAGLPVLWVLWLIGGILALAKLCEEMLLLKKAGESLAATGTMDLATEKLHWEFREHGENLGKIHVGMAHAMEEQLRSERLKTELITNVSHDLKTPLTSIINYVDLLGSAPDEETRKEYVQVLSKHAQRLKKLTEDLLEASKASTGNLTVSFEPCNLCESLRQAAGEYAGPLEEAKLEPVVQLPPRDLTISADGKLLWRVLDNLLSNVSKYSLPGTRVYLQLREEGGRAVLGVKNVSREALNVSPDELLERFVRGDIARSTEGSGLGLSIARNLTEMQGGTFTLAIDGDLFKAELCFPLQGQ